ncbi:MAG: hypothetical protein A3D92_13185 [Bacteroidetes bacterium RIFCSPHIGHO2_02_FULL_44_7]|nr:MAG: hypothetical protein A3D92_13185 [Bacteroidetes bacterium RIFCSPHIGHO2_02_FULL_44_7]
MSPPVSTIPTTTAVGSKMLTESIAQINLELGFLETELVLNEISTSALVQKYAELLNAYNWATPNQAKKSALTNIFRFLHNLIKQLEEAELLVSTNDVSSPFLANFNQLKSNPNFIAEVQKLIRFVYLLTTLNAGTSSSTYVNSGGLDEPGSVWISTQGELYADVKLNTTFINPLDFAQPQGNKSRDQILSEFDAGVYVDYQLIFASIGSLANGNIQSKVQLERRLFTEDQAYIAIQNAVNENMKQIPSQGAIAGIYCTNDRDRGVWKSPANLAVQGIEKPLVEVSNRQQDDLNVDSVSGKSVNVIRTFTGKGPLVWGARTLAGNDNEWRYISVRRFFNFAEESISLALRDFLFEPNNELTWVKIKAMITSFLVNQWQLGALTGAKMSEAFFVKVGEDTTSQGDINNGFINIQVGLAVARPAEFIVIEFSHHLKS